MHAPTTPPPPLPNLGNTCYMNASIQLLRCLAWGAPPGAAPSPLVSALRAGDARAIKREVERRDPAFRGCRQHDAHEFMLAFLDIADKDQTALPHGTLQSYVRCQSTDDTSTVDEPFLILSLPLPERRARLDLDDCVHELQEEEVLRGPDVWRSPAAERRRITPIASAKGMRVSRWPAGAVVFHLKRFSADRRKRRDPVECPDAWNGRSLRAFVVHQGVYGGGHYVAVVRGPAGGWHLCNDSHVSRLGERGAADLRRQSYILLYA